MAKDRRSPDKAELRAAAERGMADFLAKGRTVSRGPDVVPTLMTCQRCGAQAMVGVAAEQRRSPHCPKCGAVLG